MKPIAIAFPIPTRWTIVQSRSAVMRVALRKAQSAGKRLAIFIMAVPMLMGGSAGNCARTGSTW